MKIASQLTSTSANVKPNATPSSAGADSFPHTFAATVAQKVASTSEHKENASPKQDEKRNQSTDRSSKDSTAQLVKTPEVSVPAAGAATSWALPDGNANDAGSSAGIGIDTMTGGANGTSANTEWSNRLGSSSPTGEPASETASQGGVGSEPPTRLGSPSGQAASNEPGAKIPSGAAVMGRLDDLADGQVVSGSTASRSDVSLAATGDGSSAGDIGIPVIGAITAQLPDGVAALASFNPSPASDLHTMSSTSTGEVQGAALNAKATMKGLTPRQTDLPGKGKTFSLDSRGSRDKDLSDAAQAGTTASVEPAGKAAESLGNGNQNTQGPKDSGEVAAIQQVIQPGQADAATREQQPAQEMLVSAGANGHSPVGGAASADTLPRVDSAQLIQSMHHSEMRLGMQSTEFGNISISTSLNHQSLSAQISIDHSELGRALAVHLPAIQEKLGSAYGVQARVEVRDGSSASSQGSSGQQSKDGRESHGGGAAQTGGAVFARLSAQTSSTAMSMGAVASLIDIRI